MEIFVFPVPTLRIGRHRDTDCDEIVAWRFALSLGILAILVALTCDALGEKGFVNLDLATRRRIAVDEIQRFTLALRHRRLSVRLKAP